MTTNELEGRALHEAAARAIGWKPFDVQHMEHDMPSTERLLAHLTKKGIVHTASGNLVCEVRFMSLPGMEFIPGEDERPSHVRGHDLREALARLVVAVAAREAKQA